MKHSSRVDQRPSFQFYPDDWLSETGLRLCGLSARGLWIELLCHAFKSEKRGQLVCQGRAMGCEALANLVGRSVAEVEQALSELIANGVAGKAKDGTIYSRRMVRDEKQRHSKVIAGHIGARKRWGIADGMAKGMAKHRSPTPTPTPTPTPRKLTTLQESQVAKEILTLYAKIKPPSEDTSRSRAKEHVVKLLRTEPEEKLLLAVKNYKTFCERKNREADLRKNAGNFFGRDKTWKDFAAETWEPPPQAPPKGLAPDGKPWGPPGSGRTPDDWDDAYGWRAQWPS